MKSHFEPIRLPCIIMPKKNFFMTATKWLCYVKNLPNPSKAKRRKKVLSQNKKFTGFMVRQKGTTRTKVKSLCVKLYHWQQKFLNSPWPCLCFFNLTNTAIKKIWIISHTTRHHILPLFFLSSSHEPSNFPLFIYTLMQVGIYKCVD